MLKTEIELAAENAKVNLKHIEQIACRLRTEPLICGDTAYTPMREPDQARIKSGLPLVSIVTVTMNAAATLEAAILSVASQSYAGPIEFLIIDGGSTDDTLHIVEKHRSHIDCLVSEPDKGIYDAMNKGLRRARGKYVALLNADDRLLPDFVSESVRVLEETGADISYGDWFEEQREVVAGPPCLGLLFNHQGLRHNTFIHKRDSFEKIGGFDTSFRIISDAKWYRAAFLSALSFVKIAGTHFFYSMDGLSNAKNENMRQRIFAEQIRLTQQAFENMDVEEAKVVYQANFNPTESQRFINIHQKFFSIDPIITKALGEAVRWNFSNRPGYSFDGTLNRFQDLLKLADYFDIGLDQFQIANVEDDDQQAVSLFLKSLHAITECFDSSRRVCLHFAKVFSTETETFIHDLLSDLQDAEPDVLHVMLCDRRINVEVRPWPHVLVVPWDDLGPEMGRLLYDLLWRKLSPERVIAHFALNGWALHQRLTLEQRAVPWLNMCHGIDVFTIPEQPDYACWVRDYCGLAPKVGFTVPSAFLRDQLVAGGVPESKITLVPNAVAGRFLDHVKDKDFWTPERPLRLLCVGRMIRWKGQHILLEALARLRAEMPDLRLEVTFVYGGEARELDRIKVLAQELGLFEDIYFLPFVDFGAEPDFFAKHDLFVLPSTLSDDANPRTETFGVAILEAMVAGLPVIGTDVGGIPEVVGPENAMTRIVPHGDPLSLCAMLVDMISHPTGVFKPAIDRAAERAATFSTQVRLRQIKAAFAHTEAKGKRIMHFCALTRGGAAGATLNIHKGLLRLGYDSVFVTRSTEDLSLLENIPQAIALAPDLAADYIGMQARARPGFTIFSLDDHVLHNETLCKLVADVDLINLAWTAQFLSSENIAALSHQGKPIVITLRDMHPITGGCHYFHGCHQWTSGCETCPQMPAETDTGFAGLTLRHKLDCWNHDAITFVGLSDHSINTLQQSPLTTAHRCLKLANYVDTRVFYHVPKDGRWPTKRGASLKIGYLPSFDSRVKGHAELVDALRLLKRRRPDLKFELVLATGDAKGVEDLPCAATLMGRLEGGDALRAFYSNVDLIAVPSLEETFSNTCLEALACGTPVVGFATGVLPEVLLGGDKGACVPVGDVSALAKAFEEVSARTFDHARIAQSVAEEFGPELRMRAYAEAFDRLMSDPPEKKPYLPDTQPELLLKRFMIKDLIMTEKLKTLNRKRAPLQEENEWLKYELALAQEKIARMSNGLTRLSRSNWIRLGNKLKVTKALRDVRSGMSDEKGH